MITEIVFLTIDPARAEAFEAAVGAAVPHFLGARGCHGLRLERVHEDSAHYRLIVAWESVEAHMIDFRQSEGFVKWRELAGPFFVEPPRVEHWLETAIRS